MRAEPWMNRTPAKPGTTIECPNCRDANSAGDYQGPTCEVCHGDGRLPKPMPCPFCGTGGSIVEPIKNDYGRWNVVCGCCGCHGGNRPDNDIEKQIVHWNTRRK